MAERARREEGLWEKTSTPQWEHGADDKK